MALFQLIDRINEIMVMTFYYTELLTRIQPPGNNGRFFYFSYIENLLLIISHFTLDNEF